MESLLKAENELGSKIFKENKISEKIINTFNLKLESLIHIDLVL